jgi:hypothetical protein
MGDTRKIIGPKGRKKQYVPKRGVATKHGANIDDAPLASRQLTLREMRDAGIWVPLTEKQETKDG